MTQNILGISCFYHDSAITLLRDGEIVSAVQEERFSRKKNDASFKPKSYYFHVGLYAYRPSSLDKYISFGEGNLENIEGLEQLRFLENNLPIKCIPVRRKKQE